jgi:fatty acid desaturase
MESKAITPMKAPAKKPLPLGEMKKIVQDLFPVNPLVYWADFLLTTCVAWGAIYLTQISPSLSAAELLSFAVSVFALLRAALFIHELTHQERKHLPGFSVVWNLIIGVPFLVPSLMYRGVHIDHHRKSMYGTDEDGEYLPFGASPLWRSALYVGQAILIPFLLVLRYLVLPPISLLHPRVRKIVVEHCSSFAIRTDTARRVPTDPVDLRNWYVLETLCFTWALTITILVVQGVIPLTFVRHMYLLTVATFFVNSVRTLVAHRYRNRAATELTYAEQYEDSINVEGPVLVMELIAPVGLRYHALHHLFPAMPYYNLGIAHRRLKAQLPADSIYHDAIEPTLWSAFATHVRNTRQAAREEAELDAGSSHA